MWTIEATENDFKELTPVSNRTKESLQEEDSPSALIQSSDVAGGFSRRRGRSPFAAAWSIIPADKLILSTDCGFGRQGFNRHLAFYKTVGITMGRKHHS